ncbi:MAG: hypothetical protein H7Z43_15415 [Clostridia bacterium]|nr:hypothetical protein [Deltaproteobacteria bacterium]
MAGTTAHRTTPKVDDGHDIRTSLARSATGNGGPTRPAAGLAPRALEAKPAKDYSTDVLGGVAGFAAGGLVGAGAALAFAAMPGTGGLSLFVYIAILAIGTVTGAEHRRVAHAIEHATQK